MTQSRSSNASHYGSLAEKKMAEKYGFDLDRSSNRDGCLDGDPVEVKATMRKRRDGSPGRYRLFREQHQYLKRRSGIYVFVVYRVRGKGIQTLDDRSIPAEEISVDWGPSNHGSPNRDRQTKIRYDEVF
jgi:hypothetical protein